MLGQLVPCGGGPPIPLLKPKLLVGRQSFCDIPLSFPSVSSRHCELEFRDGFWFVRDLGSSNGTRVNGTACSSQRLLPNDVLSVARYRYTLIYTPAADRVPAQRAEPALAAKSSPLPAERIAPEKAIPPVRRTMKDYAAASALGVLVPCGGGDPIPLRGPHLVVGRSSGCDIVLPLASVSGRHCQLEWTEGHWFVRDLGSHNGIRVDGVRCEAKRLLPGSVLAIANQRYRVAYKPQGAEPAQERSLFDQGLLEKAGLTRFRGELAGNEPDEEESPHKRYTLDDPG